MSAALVTCAVAPPALQDGRRRRRYDVRRHVLDLDQLLRFAVEQGSSDVHVKVGSRPRPAHRRPPERGPVRHRRARRHRAARRRDHVAARRAEFQADGEADFMYGIAGLGRFRVSVFRQRGWVGLVLRRVLPGIPGFEALTLPAAVRGPRPTARPRARDRARRIGEDRDVGRDGRSRQHHRECHIVTIEDPVEVLHADKRSIVDQREVATDTPQRGLRPRARAPAGSRRDHGRSTSPTPTPPWAVLQAAETGHLVLASLSTTSAVDTVDRLVEMFEPHRQRQARALLATALRGIVSQRLLPRAGGRGRVPAVEVLVANARVRERILDAALSRARPRDGRTATCTACRPSTRA